MFGVKELHTLISFPNDDSTHVLSLDMKFVLLSGTIGIVLLKQNRLKYNYQVNKGLSIFQFYPNNVHIQNNNDYYIFSF